MSYNVPHCIFTIIYASLLSVLSPAGSYSVSGSHSFPLFYLRFVHHRGLSIALSIETIFWMPFSSTVTASGVEYMNIRDQFSTPFLLAILFLNGQIKSFSLDVCQCINVVQGENFEFPGHFCSRFTYSRAEQSQYFRCTCLWRTSSWQTNWPQKDRHCSGGVISSVILLARFDMTGLVADETAPNWMVS